MPVLCALDDAFQICGSYKSFWVAVSIADEAFNDGPHPDDRAKHTLPQPSFCQLGGKFEDVEPNGGGRR